MASFDQERTEVIQHAKEFRNAYPNYQLKSSPLNPLFVTSQKKITEGSKLNLLAKSKLFDKRFPELSTKQKRKMNVEISQKNKMYRFDPEAEQYLDLGAPIAVANLNPRMKE
jgi:hypothetical protein